MGVQVLSKMWVILLIAIFGLSLSSHGQRTHSRSCDCEYMENGKCVYKLLLPTGGQGSGTCPSDGGSDVMSAELQNTIAKLERNFTDLSMKYSNQASQINQIYSTLFDKLLTCNAFRHCVEEPSSGDIGDDRMEQGTPGSSARSISCDSVCPDLMKEFAAIQTSMQNLIANMPSLPSSRAGGQGQGQMVDIEALNDELKQVQAAITSLNDQVSTAAEAVTLKSRVETLENNLEYNIEASLEMALAPINTRIARISTQLEDMRSQFCSKKVPLVRDILNAAEEAGEDQPALRDLYSASSEFVNDQKFPINPATMAHIVNPRGAWCPGKFHLYLTLYQTLWQQCNLQYRKYKITLTKNKANI